jgi:methylmalonyl-CoA mutase N-terminal domain/subunit
VNAFTETEEREQPPLLKVAPELEAKQIARLDAQRRARDARQVEAALEELTRACERPDNWMPAILDAVRAYATVGEIRAAMVKVHGEYREPAVF